MERSFALILDRGGMRRVWLRGRDNVQKRYLIHVAGYNLGLLMRLLTGAGTPREFIAMASGQLLDLATRCRPHRHDIRCSRQSARRIRRHDQTDPTRLNTQCLNGLLGRFRHCIQCRADGPGQIASIIRFVKQVLSVRFRHAGIAGGEQNPQTRAQAPRRGG